MPKVPKKATFGTTIGTFLVFFIVFPLFYITDGNQDGSEITSRRILYYVTTYLLLRRDVANTASGRIFHCIRTQLLLRLDVSFTASERIFLPLLPVKLQKNDRKSIVLNRKSSVFAQYLLSFRPKISQKHRYFADFMPKVVIGGNKVTIKIPLITTRYSLIIKELSISVVNVTLN